MVLATGFAILAFSAFRVNADMGLLTAITILIALAIDFLFLPSLLIMLDRRTETDTDKGGRETATSPIGP
jgi:predicted RND superfamily exporter protein